MKHLLYISEQYDRKYVELNSDYLRGILHDANYKKTYHHNAEMLCFNIDKEEEKYFVDTNYFVGVDWVVNQKAAVYVEPKLNEDQQVDFIKMLLESLEAIENLEHLEGLFHVEYEKDWIAIPGKKDLLSPILIIQFLKLVQKIVRKGLKKSYYRITENLDSRIKGKILVGHQIKENIVKNRLTKTICDFQEYGINIEENQYLKLVLEFVSSYINKQQTFFNADQAQQLKNILHYCYHSFENVQAIKNKHKKVSINKNVFYKEYNEAIKIGEYILKRFSFNINKTSETQTSTPPFWIDMSKLFELYVFGKLKKLFSDPGLVTYRDPFYGGKETDILIRDKEYRCIIDCKYKPRYENESPSLEDKRQLAGYTRLKSVYNKLGVNEKEIIRGIIIYSHQSRNLDFKKGDLFNNRIREYIDFYKLGIKLPELNINPFYSPQSALS